MTRLLRKLPAPLLVILGIVALTMSGLWIGLEPIGADPDNMYRPIKSELSRALSQKTLPLWSDLFGIGTPLAAESHVAAFYPPNWLLYGCLGVSAAYRMAIWLHFLALAAAMYAYGRTLSLTPWGAALSALSLTLSGFQASHICHEPFYSLMPYLPLSLMFAERYLKDGRMGWLAGIALAVGIQITLGHFQIQFWTACLVVMTGLWRALKKQASWRRAAGLIVAVAWAGAIAAIQLGLTWELKKIAGFDRAIVTLTFYAFPSSHLAQLAFPQLFMGFSQEASWTYWRGFGSLPDEATLYVGTVTLIFAFCGYFARRDRSLAMWRWIVPIGLVLATMPFWWLDGYLLILKIPGLGLFRAPGRYTLLTTFGLCLLAGRGYELALSSRRFWLGYSFASLFAVVAMGWSIAWSSQPKVLEGLGSTPRMFYLISGALTWVVALLLARAWRSGRIAPWLPVAFVGCELAYLFYHGTTPFGWELRFPEVSPAFRRLAMEKEIGLVAGWNRNIPVRMGYRTADPYLGITAPPPNYLLEAASHPERVTYNYLPWMQRFGVSHGVIENTAIFQPSEILWIGEDPILDAILPRAHNTPLKRTFRVERYPGAFPEAHVAIDPQVVKDWYEIFPKLVEPASRKTVWFMSTSTPLDVPGPKAASAQVLRWDGRSGEIEHDGTCDLVIRRAYYPGWTARINGGPATAVVSADGGLQSVRLPGKGVSRVRVEYTPTDWKRYGTITLLALFGAVIVAGLEVFRSRNRPARL